MTEIRINLKKVSNERKGLEFYTVKRGFSNENKDTTAYK